MKEWLKDKLILIKADLKKAWLSLTVWFNGVFGAIITTVLALPLDVIIEYMPNLQPYLSDKAFRAAMLLLLIVNGANIVLRFRTTKALRNK